MKKKKKKRERKRDRSRRKRRTFTTKKELRHVARIRRFSRVVRRIASKNIYRHERGEKKKIRRIERTREKEKEGDVEGKFSRLAVLIWPSERDDTASRRRASILEQFRASERATLFRDLRAVVRDNDIRQSDESDAPDACVSLKFSQLFLIERNIFI